jgi:aldehyde:ferredoxin oxidoreductase
MDEEKLTQAAKRYRTLVRAINIRRGMRRKDDKPPAEPLEEKISRTGKGTSGYLLQFKGWNEKGIPTKESLNELGLDYVAEDFDQRGILRMTKTVISFHTNLKRKRVEV